ncbi:UPF0764 protein C16orf89 homolog [Rhynchocyon petersi]
MSVLGLPILFLLLALSPLQTSSLPQPDTVEDKIEIANEILSSLERATVFLEERPWYFTVNSMMAFRVLQVELRGVFYAWARNPQLQSLSQRAGNLSKKLVILLRKSISYLKTRDPARLQVFQPVVKMGFWKLTGAWIHTNASMVYDTFQSPESLLRDHNNQCIMELLGTSSNASHPCSCPEFCRNLMTTPGCSGYYLNHQLLYFLFSRMVGCKEGLFKETQHFMNLYCANMMDLNQRIEINGEAHSMQGLFMGNIMLCGVGGFADFYKLEWLETILSWQDPQGGCFGKQSGCSVHDTAMAMGALGGFLYVLVKFPQAESKTPCKVSSSCAEKMVGGRHLSFQILYFLFSRMVGCTQGVYSHTEFFLKLLCSHMMNLNQESVTYRYSYGIQRLFMRNNFTQEQ